MTRPPDRVEVTTLTAVEGPSRCSLCSHEHWIWKSNAAQWTPLRWMCERRNCDCPGWSEEAYA